MYKTTVVFLACLLLTGCDPLNQKGVQIARDPQWFGVPIGRQHAAVTAFSDDLVRAIGKEEGFGVIIDRGNWDALFDYLESGRVEGVLSFILPTPSHRERYDFSEGYLFVGPVLVVPENSDVDDLWKMTGKIIGVQAGSAARLVASEVPLVMVETFQNDAQALEALAQGKVDGVLMPSVPARAFMRDLYRGVLKIVTPPLTNDALRLVTLKGKHPELIRRFDRGLKKLIRDGTYHQLEEKWSLTSARAPHTPRGSAAPAR